MEDQSNTINEKEQSRLSFYSDKKTYDFLESLESHILLDKTSSKKTNLKIKLQSDHIAIDHEDDCITIKCEQRDALVTLLHSLSSLQSLENLSQENKTSTNLNLSDYLLSFKRTECFKSYSHAQILLHVNGQGEAFSLMTKDSEIIQSNIPVAEFNTLFTKIKKSKNNLFNQKELQLDFITSVGAFLAKEITTTHFSYIIIISRNDIFNPEDSEINLFEKLALKTKFQATRALNRFIKNRRDSLVKSILENFPISLEYEEVNDQYSIDQVKYLDKGDSFHQERLELMGELLNTLRHELSNPLFGINISSGLLASDSHPKDELYTETIEDIATSSKRCQDILESFTNLYDTNEGIRQFNLNNLIKETLLLTKSESKFFRPEIICREQDPIFLKSNPTLLSQVIFNLVINSSQALKNFYEGNEGKITISLKIDEQCIIEVLDNGPGIQSNTENIFTPFYTTKERGTGLGLTICKNIMQKLGGDIVLDQNYEKGSKFILRLPYE